MRHKFAINFLPEMCDKYVRQTCRQLCINKNVLSLNCQRYAGNMLHLLFLENAEGRLRTIVFAKSTIYDFHCFNQPFLNTVYRYEEISKILYINSSFLFYLRNPRYTSSDMFYVLCPITLPLDHI